MEISMQVVIQRNAPVFRIKKAKVLLIVAR